MIKDRSISTASNRHFDMMKKSNAGVDLTDWQTVYRFPLIVHARIFARSKLYLTLITLISAPNAIFLYYSGKFIVFKMSTNFSFNIINTNRFRCDSIQRDGGNSLRYRLFYCPTLCFWLPFSTINWFCLHLSRPGTSQNFTFNIFWKSAR